MLTCLLASCSGTRFVVPLAKSSTLLTPAELFKLRTELFTRWHEINQVRVLMRGQLTLAGERQGMKAALVWSAPQKLRFETFPAVGAYSLTLLTADGPLATFLDVRAKVALRGDDQKIIGEILGVAVQREELVGMLLGRLPASVLQRSDLVAYRDNMSADLMLLWDENKRWARLDKSSGLVQALAYGDAVDGQLVLSSEIKSKFVVASIVLPGQVQVQAPERDFILSLETVSANFASSLSDSLFQTEIPSDFEIHS